MPSQEEIKETLERHNLQISDLKSEGSLPFETKDQQRKKPDLDEDAISKYIIKILKDDEYDKVSSRWVSKRKYDTTAYYLIKDSALSQTPWPNSANFPEPITPVMVDTISAGINGSMFYDTSRIVSVKGEGIEDKRIAPYREKLLNAQIRDYLDIYNKMTLNTFQTALYGTSIMKVVRNPNKIFGIDLHIIPIEDFYLPLNAHGVAIDQTDHVIQTVGLTIQDLIFRMQLRDENGGPLFKNLDKIKPGWTIGLEMTQKEKEMMNGIYDSSSKISDLNRNTYYLGEADITWYHSAGAKPIELKVWFVPSTGAICRWVLNEDILRGYKDTLRAYSDFCFYPNPFRAFHISVPEKIRTIQEEATYTSKQIIDASDKAIMQAGFIDDGNEFDESNFMRVPGGIYPIRPGSRIQWEQSQVSPIIQKENQLERYWKLAERVLGISDLEQGVQPDRRNTATTDILRSKRSALRFANLLRNYNEGMKEMIKVLDYLNEKYMPKEVASSILGVTEVQSINELYPKDEIGTIKGMVESRGLNFSLSNKPLDEVESELKDQSNFWGQILLSPFGQEKAIAWKCFDKISKSYNIDDFSEIVPKPEGVNVLSPEQLISRVMSGETNVRPDPSVNPQPYLNAIKAFKFTLSYKYASLDKKQLIDKILISLELISLMQKFAMNDYNKINAEGILNDLILRKGQNESTLNNSVKTSPSLNLETKGIGIPNV